MTTTDNNMVNAQVTDVGKSSTKQPTELQPRVVIVGSGFGGLLAARALRDAPVQVTVIDKSNHHLFQPLLYQVATAGLSPADISAPIRSILKKQANTRVLMAEVRGIDTQEQRVIAGEISVPYDYLIVATGARHSYFGHNEWEQYAPGLKSITDATAIRRDILLAFEAAERETDPEKRDALLTFVLVGAGPTGVEMAGAIGELAHKALAADFRNIDPKSARIILVEAGPRILPVYPESQSSKAQKALNRLGVEVRTSAAVENITEDGVVIAGKLLPAKTIIWTAGVAASAAGQWLGAEVDRAGRVKVTNILSLPEHPNVFVIGDTASVAQDGKLLPGVAPVAMQEGRYVASLIAQKVAGKDDKDNVSPFHYHDKGNLATVGRSFGIVDIGRFRFSGFLAWVTWLFIHIFYLIGFRNRFLVMFQWAWAYLTFQRGARLITFETHPNKPV
ncbi:MAG TPA: NAD(P)/FAD-dependent oxidoreductase [Ktedonobacteraceae bacterium]|nr:NAD(P)/FAD-dependent oxidoreductase [Ktedonobacteraceae bacterium]